MNRLQSIALRPQNFCLQQKPLMIFAYGENGTSCRRYLSVTPAGVRFLPVPLAHSKMSVSSKVRTVGGDRPYINFVLHMHSLMTKRDYL